jgi:hypothetical protein
MVAADRCGERLGLADGGTVTQCSYPVPEIHYIIKAKT